MSKRTPAANANGHRRRQLIAHIKARDTHCALCNQPLDFNAPHLHPREVVIDEDLPRSRGGNPLDPANCNAMCRACNRWKGTMTLAEARHALQAGATLGQPLTKQHRRTLFTPNIGQWERGATRWT